MAKKIMFLVTLMVAFCAVPVARAADGNELFGFGAVQKSLGGGGAASAKDATWVIINPASIIDLKKRADLSFEWLHVRVKADPNGFPLVANPFAGDMLFSADVAIPTGGVVWPLGEDDVLGFGMIGLAGDRTDFDSPRSTLGYFGNGDRRAGMEVAKMPIAYAHRFDNGLTLSGALVPAVIRFRTDSLTLSLLPTRGHNRHDWAFGVGVQFGIYRNWDKWGVGATYTSPTASQRFSKYEHDLIPWSFDLPESAQAGIAYRPIKPLEFVLDYKWIDWSSVNIFGRKTINGGLAWQDQHIVKGGVSWQLNDKLTLRGGVSVATDASIHSNAVFANTLTPAIASIHAGTGFTYNLSKNSAINVSYSQSIPATKTDNGKGDIFSLLGKGTKVSYEEHSLTVEYSWLF